MRLHKLTFITPIWRRHDLTKVVLSYLKTFQREYGFRVIVGGSEGKESEVLAKEQGFKYVELENYPVSQKNNSLMLEAKKDDPDAVVILGSDDLISKGALEYYCKLIEQKAECVTFNDLYFYSAKYQVMSYYKSSRTGIGRYFSKKAMEKVSYRAWSNIGANKGLDNINRLWMASKGVKMTAVSMRQLGFKLIDIKYRENITTENIIFVGERINLSEMPRGVKKKVDNLEPNKKPVKKGEKPKDLPKNAKKAEPKKTDDNKVTVEFLEDKKGFWSKGQKKRFARLQAEKLIEKGFCKKV